MNLSYAFNLNISPRDTFFIGNDIFHGARFKEIYLSSMFEKEKKQICLIQIIKLVKLLKLNTTPNSALDIKETKLLEHFFKIDV
tara:strand:+ start:342 stop:593 length:252 start_codon:yes stop_codon:yes gene_type:complete